MTTFTIDTGNDITASAAAEQVPEGQDRFATEKDFARLSSDWPIARFVEVWNAFAGVPPFGDLKGPGQEVHRPQDRGGPHLESDPGPDARTSATQWYVRCGSRDTL